MKRRSGATRSVLAAPLFYFELARRQLVTSSRGWAPALLTVAIVFAPGPTTAKEYEFSGGASAVNIQGNGWSGHHSFLNVYCVDFPDPGSVYDIEEGSLSGNATSYFRATYKGMPRIGCRTQR